jgi:hypothetical protein
LRANLGPAQSISVAVFFSPSPSSAASLILVVLPLWTFPWVRSIVGFVFIVRVFNLTNHRIGKAQKKMKHLSF